MTPTRELAWLMCCTAACTKFSVGEKSICSSRKTSSRLFVQKVVNIFFCTVLSLLICTPINHLEYLLNLYEVPAFCSRLSSICC